MTTAPVMSITDELLAELEHKAQEAIADSLPYGASDLYDPAVGLTSAETTFSYAANPKTVLALVAHTRSLTERLEKAEKDAARYLWLRDRGDETFLAFSARTGYSAKKCDAAIDAAIARESADHE